MSLFLVLLYAGVIVGLFLLARRIRQKKEGGKQ